MHPSLVLLPGMDGTGILFDPLLKALGGAIKTSVVAYPPQEPLGYAALTAFARKRLPVNEPFVIVGESFSGPIAIQLAAERPAGLAGLIVCASFVASPTPWLRPLQRLVRPVLAARVHKLLGSQLMFGAASTSSLKKLLDEAMGKVDLSVLAARMRAALSVDVTAEAASLMVPVMYLQSTDDRLVPVGATNRFLHAVPHAGIVTIKAPHAVLQTAPEESAAAIKRFLAIVGR